MIEDVTRKDNTLQYKLSKLKHGKKRRLKNKLKETLRTIGIHQAMWHRCYWITGNEGLQENIFERYNS